MKINQIYHMDCLEGMKLLDDKSVDCILCDLPYGITDNAWDVIIPFDLLWEQYLRIIKDDGAIILTACSGFTNAVINSMPELYRYKWIWVKNNVTNFHNAKNKPMSSFEEVLIFSKANTANHSKNKMKYYPQGLVKIKKDKQEASLFMEVEDDTYQQEYKNYPNDVLYIKQDGFKFHPTQKPVELFEYLIKTYTKDGELVLDNCMGSGTTAIACRNSNRNFIGFEKNEIYYEKSLRRIEKNVTQMKLL